MRRAGDVAAGVLALGLVLAGILVIAVTALQRTDRIVARIRALEKTTAAGFAACTHTDKGLQR